MMQMGELRLWIVMGWHGIVDSRVVTSLLVT
jgi:hypothetical protein